MTIKSRESSYSQVILFVFGLMAEIYKEAPGRRRECLYYLALGQYKLGHYNEARKYNDLLLDKEPRNMQALSLKALIEDRVAKGILSGVRLLLTVRGIRGNGNCRECGRWVYCCCGFVDEAALGSWMNVLLLCVETRTKFSLSSYRGYSKTIMISLPESQYTTSTYPGLAIWSETSNIYNGFVANSSELEQPTLC